MNINKAAFALKSLMKELESDLKTQNKVEDKVPEKDTESLRKLLDFTNKETSKRPKVSKPGSVEQGKKVKNKSSKSKHVKKSVEELKILLHEINTYKAAQSPDAREVGAAGVGAALAFNPNPGVGDKNTLRGDELDEARADNIINPVNPTTTGPQTIGGEVPEEKVPQNPAQPTRVFEAQRGTGGETT